MLRQCLGPRGRDLSVAPTAVAREVMRLPERVPVTQEGNNGVPTSDRWGLYGPPSNWQPPCQLSDTSTCTASTSSEAGPCARERSSRRRSARERAPRPVEISRSYVRRAPEHGVLHRVVRERLNTFLWELDRQDDERGVPLFVKRELQRFVRYGMLGAFSMLTQKADASPRRPGRQRGYPTEGDGRTGCGECRVGVPAFACWRRRA